MNWVAHMQRALAEAGHDPGPVDGFTGPATYTALFAYMSKPGADPAILGKSAATEFPKAGITNSLRLAHWFAQFSYESDGFSRLVESLDYSVARLMQVWPKRFPDVGSASAYSHNPELLAEKVYGGRMGNYDPGDGWRYRGRGPQLTGRANYEEAEELTGLPLVNQPDLAALPHNFVKIACAYWVSRRCNSEADEGDLIAVTKAVNGALIGLDGRRQALIKAMKMIGP